MGDDEPDTLDDGSNGLEAGMLDRWTVYKRSVRMGDAYHKEHEAVTRSRQYVGTEGTEAHDDDRENKLDDTDGDESPGVERDVLLAGGPLCGILPSVLHCRCWNVDEEKGIRCGG